MFLSKLLIYSTVAGAFFTVSTFTTINITKQLNKTPISNITSNSTNLDSEEEEDEDDFSIPDKKETSDQELLIAKLTTFGNMEANVNLDITYQDYQINIQGDAFVSLESLLSPKVNANLKLIALDYIESDISATYINDTIYLSIDDRNVKLATSDISAIIDLFNNESEVTLPNAFSNIDANSLLVNLGKMTAEKEKDEIIYTCNLIDNLPPVTFKSDLDHNLTGIEMKNVTFGDAVISLEATTNILGFGKNKVAIPESSDNPYIDASNYFGIIKQVKDYISNPQFDIAYNVDIKKDNNDFISTSGEAYLDLNNDIKFNIEGNLYNEDKSLSSPYVIGYLNQYGYLSYQDDIKLKYDIGHFEDLKSSFSSLISNELISNLLGEFDDISIPLIDIIKTKDYRLIYEKYNKDIEIKDDYISLSFNNTLLNENNDNDIKIKLSIDEEGIKHIYIDELSFDSYSLNLVLEVKPLETYPEIDLSQYNDLSNVDILINQINELLTKQKIAGNVSLKINDLEITGFVQADIKNNDYILDIEIKDNDNVHLVKLDHDESNYYISYNDDINVYLSRLSIKEIMEVVIENINDKESALYSYLSTYLDKVDEIEIPAISLDNILFNDFIEELSINENQINIVIPNNVINMENDLSIDINLDETKKIKGLSTSLNIDNASIDINIDLKEYDDEYNLINDKSTSGKWVNASSCNEVINYASNLSKDSIDNSINQIKKLLADKEVGINYTISLDKGDTHLFSSTGDLYANFLNKSNISLSLSGDLINKEIGKELNKTYDIKYLDNVVYLDYNNELKLSYSKAGIEGLINIIKTRLPSSDNDGMTEFLNKILPSTSSINSPLINIIQNEEYYSLVNYFKYFKNNNGYLEIYLDASILGAEKGDIILKIKLDEKGVAELIVEDLYFYGFYFDCNFVLEEYIAPTIEDESSYTSLEYVNDIFNHVLDLMNEDQFAFDITGTVSNSSTNIEITSGYTQFYLGKENGNVKQDIGLGSITLLVNDKSHKIDIDVTRNNSETYIPLDNDTEEDIINNQKNLDKEALESSYAYFTYNDELKGRFNLASISDTYNLIMDLVNSNDQRFEKFKALLTVDMTNTVIHRILNNQEIELILYNNIINNISYLNNTYSIELNSNLIKEDSSVDVDSLYINLKLDDSHKLDGLNIKGKVLDYDINLTVNLAQYDENYSVLDTSNSDDYYDFSDMNLFIKYLLNTAKLDDFNIDGSINVTFLGWETKSVPVSAKINIQQDNEGKEHVVGKIQISSIPCIRSPLGLLVNYSDEQWDNRTFTIYLNDDYVYLNVDYDRMPLIGSRKYYNKNASLTMDEFTSNLGYYLLNYGFGIDQDKINANSDSSENNIKLERLLTNYSYNSNSWNIGISMSELANTAILGDLKATISTSENDNERILSALNGDMSIATVLGVTIDLAIDSNDYIGDETYKEINTYIKYVKLNKAYEEYLETE